MVIQMSGSQGGGNLPWLPALTFFAPGRMESASIPEYNVDLKNAVEVHDRRCCAYQGEKPSYQVSLNIRSYRRQQIKI